MAQRVETAPDTPGLAEVEAASQAAYEQWRRLRSRAVTLRIRLTREVAADELERCRQVLLDDGATERDRRAAMSAANDAMHAVMSADADEHF